MSAVTGSLSGNFCRIRVSHDDNSCAILGVSSSSTSEYSEFGPQTRAELRLSPRTMLGQRVHAQDGAARATAPNHPTCLAFARDMRAAIWWERLARCFSNRSLLIRKNNKGQCPGRYGPLSQNDHAGIMCAVPALRHPPCVWLVPPHRCALFSPKKTTHGSDNGRGDAPHRFGCFFYSASCHGFRGTLLERVLTSIKSKTKHHPAKWKYLPQK